MLSKIRNLLIRIVFHSMSFKKYFKRKRGGTSPSFTISTLRTLQIFPASKIREQTVYLFCYIGYSTLFACYSTGEKESAADPISSVVRGAWSHHQTVLTKHRTSAMLLEDLEI